MSEVVECDRRKVMFHNMSFISRPKVKKGKRHRKFLQSFFVVALQSAINGVSWMYQPLNTKTSDGVFIYYNERFSRTVK